MLKLISILPKRVKFEFIFGGFLIFVINNKLLYSKYDFAVY